MTQTANKVKGAADGVLSQLPVDRLKEEAQGFGKALGHKGLSVASGGIDSLTNRLNDYASGKTAPEMGKNLAKGDSPVKAGVKAVGSKVKDAVGSKLGIGGGAGQKLKVTNIVESIDVPVSRDVAYQQWTQFEDFPNFTKKVESVKQDEDEVVSWKAQIFWSHRTWKATIVDQVPNERIVWKSEGEKGHVDGAVTFHELAPDLTRILLTLEYHPKGLFEHTGNLWRAQGRRARLELKHFRRHVATQTLIKQDEVEGWPGEIHDEKVTDSGQDGDSDTDESQNEEGTDDRSDEDSMDDRGDQGDQGDEATDDQSDQQSDQQSEERPTATQQSGQKSGQRSGQQSSKKASAKKSPAKKSATSGAGS